MFDKIKRAISGWSQDSPASGKDKDKLKLSPPPLRQHSTLVKKESKSPNAFRNSLPARFRNSVYRDLSSSSEVLPLPTSTSSSSPLRDDTFSSPSPGTSPVTPTPTSPSQAPEIETTHEASPSAQTSPRPIPKVASSSPDLMTGSPKKLYITRASSFQSKESSEMRRSEDAAEDKDIIIFSSTPPVSINRSASVKIPRKGVPSLHKGSPDHNYALPSSFGSMNQETPVVQWPRGGASSAANRSQEHFLRSHRRTSTSSDASIKDLQTSSQIATTPPVTSILRQESIQRPSLDRQTSRSGVLSGDIKHKKTPSNASAESLSMDTSSASAGVIASAMTDSPSSSSGGPSLNSSPAIEQPQRLASSSTDAETPKAEALPSLNPTVSRQLALGTQMLKISAKKQHSRLFKLDLEQGRILWDSRKLGRSKLLYFYF